jgi:hypothetical protein
MQTVALPRYRPQHIDVMRRRLQEAVGVRLSPSESPTDDPRCVFDFYSGLRLVIARQPKDNDALGVAAFAHPGSPLEDFCGGCLSPATELYHFAANNFRALTGRPAPDVWASYAHGELAVVTWSLPVRARA